MRPSARVLDLFAVPDVVEPLPGGQGSVRAGDLVLSPDRHPGTRAWLSPVLARLAVRLDEDAAARRALRVAVPVPARDGSWVVDGWAACRYEPGTVPCRSLDVVLATGHLLHARLATLITTRPMQLDTRTDRWFAAERLAFDEAPIRNVEPAVEALIAEAREAMDGDAVIGPSQLVHADLAGNVLLDRNGVPVVLDVSPAWRPQLWADAVCVLDSVLRPEAPSSVLDDWTHGRHRTAMLRAIVFRLVSDVRPEVDAYAAVLRSITTQRTHPSAL